VPSNGRPYLGENADSQELYNYTYGHLNPNDPMWGSAGRGGSFGATDGSAVGDGNQEFVTVNGKEYARVGTQWEGFAGEGGEVIDHPVYGKLVDKNFYLGAQNRQKEKNAKEFDIGKLGVMGGGMLASGALLAGLAPGINAMGQMIPAGQTGILNQLAQQGFMDVPGAQNSASWGAGPQGMPAANPPVQPAEWSQYGGFQGAEGAIPGGAGGVPGSNIGQGMYEMFGPGSDGINMIQGLDTIAGGAGATTGAQALGFSGVPAAAGALGANGGFWSAISGAAKSLFSNGKNNEGNNLMNSIGGLLEYFAQQGASDDYLKASQEASRLSDPFREQRPFYQQELKKSYTDPDYFQNNSTFKGIQDEAMRRTEGSMAAQGFNQSGRMLHEVGRSAVDAGHKYVQPFQAQLAQNAGAGISPGYAGFLQQQGSNLATQANLKSSAGLTTAGQQFGSFMNNGGLDSLSRSMGLV
jgi:hypothetical protein